MSDGNLGPPPPVPQPNLAPRPGYETTQPASPPSGVQYSPPAAQQTLEAPLGHGTLPDADPPKRSGLNAPRIIGLLALIGLIALVAWLLSSRGDDDGEPASEEATTQVAEDDSASSGEDADASSDDDEAMSDDEQAIASDSAADDEAMASEGSDEDEAMADSEPGTVVDTMLANSELSIVADGIGQLGLDNDLAGEGPFTILAPTNDAFFLVSEDEASRLLGSEANASSVLGYHVLLGNFSSENFVTALEAQGGTLTVDSLSGEEITVELIGDQVVLNGSSVVIDPDQESTNGVVHTISDLLVPPSLATR